MKQVIYLLGLASIFLNLTIGHADPVDNVSIPAYYTVLNINWYNAPAINVYWSESMDWAANLNAGGEIAWESQNELNREENGPLRHLFRNECERCGTPIHSDNP